MIIEDFQIFNNDTELTIVQRVADSFNSVPKFILIAGIYNRDRMITTTVDKQSLVDIKKFNNVRIDVWDGLSTVISNATKQGSTFHTFYTTSVKTNVEKCKILPDVIFIWCHTKIQMIGATIDENFIELIIEQNVFKDIISVIPNMYDLINRNDLYNKLDISTINNYFTNLRTQIQKNRENVQRIVNAYEIQKSIKGVVTTEFEREQNKIRWITDIKTMSIFEIFDAIVLSSKAPFASVDTFYKILKNYRINRDWVETSKDKLIIKFFNTPTSDPVDIVFYIENDTVNITATLDVARNEQPENDMIVFIKTLIPSIKFGLEKTSIENIFGVFYIPNQKLDFYVFAHLVLNDKQFSSFFIDESEKATKTKSGIYTYYDVGGNDLVPLIITPKTVHKYDPTIRDRIPTVFTDGSQYIRVKISNAKTIENINQIIAALSKAMTLYNTANMKVITLYRRFIHNFASIPSTENAVNDARKIKFKTIDPILFSGQYSRDCQHRPDIIDENEIHNYNNVMLFPKTAEEGTQRYYTCENRPDNYTAVGLQHKKSGKPDYRYVPCCFVENQEDKAGSTYNEYFKGIEQAKQKGPQQRLVEGSKFLNYDTYGTFDDFSMLNAMFVDMDATNYRYLRWGTDMSRYSFLQCIVEAVGYEGYDTSTFETRAESTKRLLKEIVSDTVLLTTTKQAMYDKSIMDIQRILMDKNEYINPVFFRDLFEIKFNCKIIVFNSQSIENLRVAKSYVPLYDNKRPVVMVLQHLGSDPTKAPFPRCELIARTNRTQSRDVSFSFTQDIPFVSKMLEIERRTVLSHIGKTIVTYAMVPRAVFEIAKFQIINSFGKTCGVITHDGFLLYLPIPCAPLPLQESTDYRTFNARATFGYIKEKFGDVHVRQILDYSSLVAFEIVVESSTFYIPVERSPQMTTMQVSDGQIVFPRKEESSMLDRFLRFQKIARYLTEYVCFLFSNFLIQNKITIISDKIIERFIENKTIINHNIEYKIKSRFFNDNTATFLDKNGKLIIKNEELLKRLVFTLRANIAQRSQEIFEYHTRTRAENFIIDYNDFVSYPNQVIVEGKESIVKYLNERASIYPVNNTIMNHTQKVYFFSNILIGDRTYIVKNVENIDDAFAYLYNWQTHHILSNNQPDDINPRDVIDVDMYIYTPDGDISQTHSASSINKLVIFKDGVDDYAGYAILFDFY